MNGSQCGSDNGEQEEEDPNLDAKESWVSEDKGGASSEGMSNLSDSSIAQKKEGTGANGGNGQQSMPPSFPVPEVVSSLKLAAVLGN